MLNIARPAYTTASRRLFSSSPRNLADVAKLTLVGRLARQPEVRTSRAGKEFVSYTIATSSQPPPNASGEREEPRTSWHNIAAFNPNSIQYLSNLQKGSLVYAEASYELREPELGADPSTGMGQRQVFLRHETLRVLKRPQFAGEESSESSSETF